MPNWGGGASGAASGAAAGSMFGPLGTGIGAGIGGLIGLFKGGKKKKDESDISGELTGLREAAAGNRAQAGALRDEAGAARDPAMDYFQGLLSDNPAELMDATRAERGRVMDQYDTARRAVSSFGPRGGGTSQVMGDSYIQQAAQTSDILSTGKQNAAQILASMGIQLESLGMSAEQLASSDLETVIQSILGKEGLSLQKRGQNMAMLGDIGQGAGSLLGQYLGRDKAAA